ncbi:MAG: hypothetical protein BRC58_07835 [Cyanobacteria bacterium QS_8_64_29]|nr:MAG: hypothetical protein BRC58_07835 [Cyanobacteria bacterium QS_8_64_29]
MWEALPAGIRQLVPFDRDAQAFALEILTDAALLSLALSSGCTLSRKYNSHIEGVLEVGI